MSKIKMNVCVGKTINQGCQEFLLRCKARNYSKFTIKYYENTIHNFGLFYDLDAEVETVDMSLITTYVVHLSEKGVVGKTIETYVRGLRTICYFFMEQGWLERFAIKMPKYEKPMKEVYTHNELQRLLRKPNIKKCSFTQYRNWVLVNYLIGTGQRLNSIVHIRIADIDLVNQVVRLRITKNRKETLLPLANSLVKILEEYLRYRKGEESDYLFCNNVGAQMTRGCITCAIRGYNRSCGVEKTSIHLFRHSYAYNYLLNGGDVFRLQKLLCHSDLESTKEYLNLSLEDVKLDFDKLNPLEQLTTREKTIQMKKGV